MAGATDESRWDEEKQPLLGAAAGVQAPAAAEATLRESSLDIKGSFIRKVYGIFGAMLALSVLIAWPLQQISREFLFQHQWLVALACGLLAATLCAMSCCGDPELMRHFPTNYTFLFVITMLQAVVVGFIAATYQLQSVMVAVGIASVMFLGLTLFAYSGGDVTGWAPYMLVLLFAVVLFGLALAILSIGNFLGWGFLVWLAHFLGVVLVSLVIILDTQRILGVCGVHDFSFSVDDYAFAALTLYLDVINILVLLMELVGKEKD